MPSVCPERLRWASPNYKPKDHVPCTAALPNSSVSARRRSAGGLPALDVDGFAAAVLDVAAPGGPSRPNGVGAGVLGLKDCASESSTNQNVALFRSRCLIHRAVSVGPQQMGSLRTTSTAGSCGASRGQVRQISDITQVRRRRAIA